MCLLGDLTRSFSVVLVSLLSLTLRYFVSIFLNSLLAKSLLLFPGVHKLFLYNSYFSASRVGFHDFSYWTVSAMLHWGDLWVRKCHGCHTGQRGYLSDHRRPRAECRSSSKHAESHALLWHVRLLRTVCFSCKSLFIQDSFWNFFQQLIRCLTKLIGISFKSNVLLPLLVQVGLPAKSGVSGAVLLVVPNVMGMMCWSPPLDRLGNSVRGIHFCQVCNLLL